MLELDATGHVVAVLNEHRGLVLAILGNPYLNDDFWQDPCREKAGKTRLGVASQSESQVRAEGLAPYPGRSRRSGLPVPLPVGPRCRHAPQWTEPRGGPALRDMAGLLVPTFLLVWIDRDDDEDWASCATRRCITGPVTSDCVGRSDRLSPMPRRLPFPTRATVFTQRFPEFSFPRYSELRPRYRRYVETGIVPPERYPGAFLDSRRPGPDSARSGHVLPRRNADPD